MKLLIIRHADPDYEADSLTEQGFKEAELLSKKLSGMDIRAFYVSPLGRAKATAKPTLEKMNQKATECPWLREFAPKIHRPDRENPSVAWDWLPQDWTKIPEFYDKDAWMNEKHMMEGDVAKEYDWIARSLDELLENYGYVRDGKLYRVIHSNTDTIAFFCHFGLECVLLSHLLSISPMALWHGFCAAPSSVTTLTTEERRKGAASFRINCFGDVSHLYIAGEQPSFSARFCECFENKDQRHD